MLGRTSGCFPLYLTPLELYFLTDDHLGFSQTFVVQFAFQGTADRSAFEASLGEALQRHPLLAARVEPLKRGRLCWTSAQDAPWQLDWGDATRPVECPPGSFDLGSQPGLRIWVRQGQEQVRMICQFSHVCTDGIGAYRFLGDLLALYGQRTASEGLRPELAPINLESLRNRHRGLMREMSDKGRLRITKEALGQMVRLYAAPVAPLRSAGSSVGQPPPEFPGIESVDFTADDHHRLRHVALGLGVTMNDLMVSELFLALDQWNRRHRRWSLRNRYRIVVPMDMRTQRDFELPATNMSTLIFPTRSARQLRDPNRLVRSVRDELLRIKNSGRETMFLQTVAAATNAGLLPLFCRWPLSLATAVLSNAGDPSRRFTARFPRRDGRLVCGSLVLNEITGVPPMRPGTRATLSIFTYRRMLTVSVRCDPSTFSRQHAREFLDVYAARIRSYLSEFGRVGSPDSITLGTG